MYEILPESIQKTAIKNFQLLTANPAHLSLQFKKVSNALWSVRISDNYRSLAKKEGDLYIWFWIGTHTEYEKLLKNS